MSDARSDRREVERKQQDRKKAEHKTETGNKLEKLKEKASSGELGKAANLEAKDKHKAEKKSDDAKETRSKDRPTKGDQIRVVMGSASKEHISLGELLSDKKQNPTSQAHPNAYERLRSHHGQSDQVTDRPKPRKEPTDALERLANLLRQSEKSSPSKGSDAVKKAADVTQQSDNKVIHLQATDRAGIKEARQPEKETREPGDRSHVEHQGDRTSRTTDQTRVYHGPGFEGYATGSDKLPATQFHRLETELTKDGTKLYHNPDVTLVLKTTASRLGNDAANLNLTERRAENLKQEFIKEGFTGKFILQADGADPKSDSNPRSDRPEGRAVFAFTYQGDSKAEKAPVDTDNLIRGLADALRPPEPAKDTSLWGQAKEEGKRAQAAWKETESARKVADKVAPGSGKIVGPAAAGADWVARHVIDDLAKNADVKEHLGAWRSGAIRRMEQLAGVEKPSGLTFGSSAAEVKHASQIADNYVKGLSEKERSALGDAIRANPRKFEIMFSRRLQSNFGFKD